MADTSTISELIEKAKHVVIVQADNPDGDSLGTALALEHILGDKDKEVTLYCGVDIPQYLRYLSGWDRVSKDLPDVFDLSIIIDTSAISLLETLIASGQKSILAKNPCIIIDHHTNVSTIDFASLTVNRPAVATAEIVYDIAKEEGWPISLDASEFLAGAILADSLGLIGESTTAHSIRVIADLVEAGVSLAKLDSIRKEYQKKTPEIVSYKGQLLQRIDYSQSGEVASVDIPWEEIQKYSHDYNPGVLVIDEMRMIENIRVAIVFKYYPDNKITAKIRCNFGSAVADKLAEKFGGGGHPYASGFKLQQVADVAKLKEEVISYAEHLLTSKQ